MAERTCSARQLDPPRRGRTGRVGRAAVLLLALLAALGATRPARAEVTLSYALSVGSCSHPDTTPAGLQLCTPIPTIAVPTAGVLRVQFVADPSHCSDIIAHVRVNGGEQYTSPRLPPGASTGTHNLGPVPANVYRIGVQAEGVTGGCNPGELASWAGTLAVTVSGVTAGAAVTAAPGATVAVSTLAGGSPAPAGLKATYVRTSSGSGLATLAAATYDHNPVMGPSPVPITPVGFVDLVVLGAVAGDRVETVFIPPNPVIPGNPVLPNPVPVIPPNPVRLVYWDGLDWGPVFGSGGVVPTYDSASTRFAVTIDATSTPAVTALTGTVFATVPSYGVVGFLAPVGSGATNVAKAGRTIPLKWRLYDLGNTPVTTLRAAVVQVSSVPVSCTSMTPGTEEITEDAAGASGLQHLGDGAYQFNWDTSPAYAGSCRLLRLDLGERNPDGTPFYRTARFHFAR